MKHLIVFFVTIFLLNVTVSGFSSSSTYQLEKIDKNIFPEFRRSENRNIFIFDPNHLAWAVYDKEGKKVGMGKAEGGADYCEDIHQVCRTPVGAYTVFRKKNENCKSRTFPINKGGASMPYCMFFHEGYAIHGYELVNANSSHGCIRVTKEAAKWINTQYLAIGAEVIVKPYLNERKSV